MIIALILCVGLTAFLVSRIDWTSMYGDQRAPIKIKIEEDQSSKR